MTELPFFVRDGDRFVPTQRSKGAWGPSTLHGRVVAGLLGREIERRHGEPDLQPARLTVDLYRLPDLSPVEVVTRVVRDGYRIRVIDAEFISNGVSAGRASCQLLRRTAAPPDALWSPPPWDVPPPSETPPADDIGPLNGMWDRRPIPPGAPMQAPRQAWMRERRELIEGEPLTPFSRVALAADFASPATNASATGLPYINSDITLYLHRLPVTEWVGFQAVNHQASGGVSIGECWIHDEQGPIGAASVAALAQSRAKKPEPPTADGG
jgi:hypothetical protein